MMFFVFGADLNFFCTLYSFFEKSTVLFARLILFEKSTVLFARLILFEKGTVLFAHLIPFEKGTVLFLPTFFLTRKKVRLQEKSTVRFLR